MGEIIVIYMFFCGIFFFAPTDIGISILYPSQELLIILETFPVRVYLTALYTIYFRAVVDWRARYFWSLSFWDVPKAKETLSRIPFPTPLYFLIFDFTIIVGILIALIYHYLTAKVFFLETEYVLRVLIHGLL
jgi:hypothetical protein